MAAEPASMYGNDVINYALTLHGILYVGQTPGANALLMCQTALNNLLAEWNAQGLAVFSVVLASYALASGTGTYTLGGSGGSPNLSTTRAEKVEAWRVHGSIAGSDGGKPLSAADFEAARIKLDVTASEMGILPTAGLAGTRVKILNYDANYAGSPPQGTLTLYPIPTFSGTVTLDLWTWDQLVAISDFSATALAFPPGYLKAIAYNLSLDLAPLFGRPIDPGVKMIADQCKATLGGTNISELTRQDPKTVPPAAR